MGRNSRLKQRRRTARHLARNELWGFFTSDQFLGEVRKMILDAGANLGSSVCCTKVLSELALSAGLDIRPLPVEVSVFNPVFTKYIEESGLNPTEAEMLNMGESGGRYVILGNKTQDDPEGKWSGHLTALMTAPNKPPTLIDLAIELANRPTHDIKITRPLVFEIPEGFLAGKSVATGYLRTEVGDICVVYAAKPLETGYLGTEEWNKTYSARTHDKIEIQEPKADE